MARPPLQHLLHLFYPFSRDFSRGPHRKSAVRRPPRSFCSTFPVFPANFQKGFCQIFLNFFVFPMISALTSPFQCAIIMTTTMSFASCHIEISKKSSCFILTASPFLHNPSNVRTGNWFLNTTKCPLFAQGAFCCVFFYLVSTPPGVSSNSSSCSSAPVTQFR